MTEPTGKEIEPDLPAHIFKEFVVALRSAGVAPEIVARLSKALLEDKTFGDVALKAALVSEAPPL